MEEGQDWIDVMKKIEYFIYAGIAASLLGIPYTYHFTDLGLAWAILLAMPSTTCFVVAAYLYRLERTGSIVITYRRRLNGRN